MTRRSGGTGGWPLSEVRTEPGGTRDYGGRSSAYGRARLVKKGERRHYLPAECWLGICEQLRQIFELVSYDAAFEL